MSYHSFQNNRFQNGSVRGRCAVWGILMAIIGIIVGSAYFSWGQPQREQNAQVHDVQIISTVDRAATPRPSSYFAALDPGLEVALLNDIPNQEVNSFAIVVEGIPPIGAYLPRTGNTLFEFPTPTPFPTEVPPTPTFTPVPSPTPPTDLGFITATPPAFFDPLGRPGPTVVAASAADCAPAGLPVSGVLTQRYHRWHIGVDLGVPLNTPVIATHSGSVMFAGWSEIGYGYLVIVQSGTFITYYAHQTSLNVRVGQSVARWSVLGWSGSTGNSSGPHVHYETRINDVPVDPLTFEQRGYGTC